MTVRRHMTAIDTSELAILRAQVSSLTAEVAVLVGALEEIKRKSAMIRSPIMAAAFAVTTATEALANTSEAAKAMGEVIEAAEAVANEFAQQHPLIKTLRTNLARLHAGRGA